MRFTGGCDLTRLMFTVCAVIVASVDAWLTVRRVERARRAGNWPVRGIDNGERLHTTDDPPRYRSEGPF